MSGGLIAAGVGAASSIAGAAGGGKGGGGGGAGASAPIMYDPFAVERQKYVKKLGRFMKDPSALYDTESYKSRFKAGQHAVSSAGAAKGLLDSGALGVELMQQGQTFASDEYDKEYQRLAQLAGVGISPSWSSGFSGANQGNQGGGWGSLAGELSEFPWERITGGGGGGTTGPVSRPQVNQNPNYTANSSGFIPSYSWG